jgi:pimeloyl-ACP methyl ester carboxylesterase
MWKPTTPVILIPGITGTTLWYKGLVNPDLNKFNAWIPITTTDPTTGTTTFLNTHFEHMYGRFDATTKRVQKVFFKEYDVYIPGSSGEPESEADSGLFAISSLCYGAINPYLILASRYFYELIEFLQSKGFIENKTLFGFGYDWRQSNQFQVPLLKKKIEAVMKATGRSKVDIVSHSMGGLVTKVFLAKEHVFFARHVRKWIALGCPFLGSPALTSEALLTGIELGHSIIEKQYAPSRDHVLNAMLYYPSLVELTPTPGYEWMHGRPYCNVWIKDTTGNVINVEHRPRHIQSVQKKVLEGRRIVDSGVAMDWAADPNVWKQGRETQTLMRAAKLPSSVQFYNLYGHCRICPFGVTYGSKDRPLDSYKQIGDCSVSNTFVDGDGTVPVESAIRDGFKATERFAINATHVVMLKDPILFARLLSWLSDGRH